VPANWYRKGYKLFANPNDLDLADGSAFVNSLPYEYISFESWDTNRAIVRPFIVAKHLLFDYAHRTLKLLDRRSLLNSSQQSKTLPVFLRWFFRQTQGKFIVQVGANDGDMCDPLRPFLQKPGNYKAILLEPLGFYAAKLRDLYGERMDVEVRQQACGAQRGDLSLFSIPPAIADQMDGDGPANRWAHGQGSFDRKIVEEWIRKNSFRGVEYRNRIPEFINSIREDVVPVVPVADCFSGVSAEDLTLLVIDAQGFEKEVLLGIDWSKPPEFIIFEDDRKSGKKAANLLRKHGYILVGGKGDKIYSLPAPGQRFLEAVIKRTVAS